MQNIRHLKVIAAACALAFTTSCANLSPHVAPHPAKSVMPTWLEGSRAVRMDRSLAYTIEQANLWRGRANDHANSQQALYAVALPTSAVAAYYAITGDRGESAITALSAVSAGAFGLSYLSGSRPKQSVYLAGSDALACVIWNAAPLAIPDATYTRMQTSAAELSALRGTLEAALSQADTAAREGDQVWKKNVEDAQAAARAESASAAATSAATYQILGSADRAPYLVYAQTQKIAAAVSQQLIALEPSPEAVLEYARTLNPAIRDLRSALAPPEAPAAPAEGQNASLVDTGVDAGAIEALAALRAATQALRNRRIELDGLVGTHLGALAAAGNVEACSAAGRLPDVTISPPSAAVKVKPGSVYKLALSGGSGAFDIRVLGENTEHVTVNYVNSPYPSRNPVVNFGADATGTVSVNIRDVADAADTGQDIVFTIERGTNQDTGGGEDEATGETQDLSGNTQPSPRLGVLVSACPKLSRAQVSIVQLALLSVRKGAAGNAAFVDGQWGKNTEDAAGFYWSDRLKLAPPAAGTTLECAFGQLAATASAAPATVLKDASANLRDERLVGAATQSTILRACFDSQTLDACWKR